MSAFTEAYRKLFPPPSAREAYTVKAVQTTDEQLVEQLKSYARHTADLAGKLHDRGWQVSVYIYPYTPDKGAVSQVSVYRTQTLSGTP